MLVLGLAGQAGVGKDTVADYLVKMYGFVRFAFSDALYAEVRCAFGLPDDALLRDRDTKDTPQIDLRLDRCQDPAFVEVARRLLTQELPDTFTPLDQIELSPRWVLQRWGTDYRRAQDPHYWLNCAEDFLGGLSRLYQYPEQAPQHFVEAGTRFENEREWIHSGAFDGLFSGNVWHIHRDSVATNDAHVSAQPLPMLEKERALYNNDTVERLHHGIDLLLTTQAKFVRVEPMAPMVAIAEPA